MYVRIKKLDERAVVPTKAHEEDFCYDLTAISEEEIAPGVWKYHTGLAFEIVPDYLYDDEWVYSLDIRPRSSIHKTGMVLSNSEGTVDFGYRGEVTVVFYHVKPELPRYKVGDRVAQLKIGITRNIIFVVVPELGEGDRGTNGYGSSGR